MQRLRDLVQSLEEQAARPPAERPTSVFQAGRVGQREGAAGAQTQRREDRPIDSADNLAAEERTPRRQPRAPVARAPRPAAPSAQRIRSTLRDPESLQTAILLREVLDPPVSRRPRRR